MTEGELRREPASGHIARATEGEEASHQPGQLEEAVGELLFAVVALARRLRVNPEDALRFRTNRFADRFRLLEDRRAPTRWTSMTSTQAEWQRRWEAASGVPVNRPTLSK